MTSSLSGVSLERVIETIPWNERGTDKAFRKHTGYRLQAVFDGPIAIEDTEAERTALNEMIACAQDALSRLDHPEMEDYE